MRMLVLLVVGCATVLPKQPSAPVAEVHDALFAIPDETMVFSIAFRGIALARTTTTVGRAGLIDGHRALIVKSGGHTEGILSIIGDLRWELTTTLDLDAARPLEMIEESWASFNGHDEHERSSHLNARYDLHAGVTALRAWRPRLGGHRTMDLEVGGGRFELDIWLAARERLRVPARRFDGIVENKLPFSIWISDDADAVPLRARVQTEFGEVVLELVEYD